MTGAAGQVNSFWRMVVGQRRRLWKFFSSASLVAVIVATLFWWLAVGGGMGARSGVPSRSDCSYDEPMVDYCSVMGAATAGIFN